MKEELREKLIYAPYHPEEAYEEIMVELGMKSNSQDVEYEMNGDYNLIGTDAQDSVKTEVQDTFNIMSEYEEEDETEEIEEIVTNETETEEYEFVTDVTFDIYG